MSLELSDSPDHQRWLSKLEVDGNSYLTIRFTPAQIAGLIILATGGLLVLILGSRLGLSIPLLRPTLAVLYLSLVPGYLFLRIAKVRPGNLTEFGLYTVGLSLTALMVFGTVLNFMLPLLGYATPIAELPLAFAITGGVGVLTGVYYLRVNRPTSLTVSIDTIASPWFISLLVLPFLAFYGAYLLNVYDNNLLLLLLYVAIAIVPILVFYDVIPAKYLPIALWLIALSLLFQNTFTGQFLAWGDQENEAAQVMHVISSGYWDHTQAPSGHINQYSMLRISILHPIYLLLTDIELFWVFRAVHPLLFSIMPVALYQAYEKYVTEKEAFLSAFLYISFFSFVTVLSRNTRTATALLFVSLLLLLIADRSLNYGHRKVLGILFAASIVVSHYGITYIMMIGLVATIPSFVVLDRLSALPIRELTPDFTTGAFVMTYLAIAYSWYLFASPQSWPFFTLVEFIDEFFTTLQDQFLSSPEETSASARYATGEFNSIILDILQFYNLALGLLIGIGFLATVYKLYQGLDTPFSKEFVAYAGVFLAIFGITFLPVGRFNTARTFVACLVFIAPFFLFGLYACRDLLRKYWKPRISKSRIWNVAMIILVLYFLLNIGFVSATVTHEYSPNVLVEKDRVMDEGYPVEKEYFYKQHPTEEDVRSTIWLEIHAESPESDVYQSTWPGNMWGPTGYPEWSAEVNEQRSASLSTHTIAPDEPIGEGYVYLNSLSYRSSIIIIESGGQFESRSIETDEIEYKWADKNKIYNNGDAAIYG